KETKQIAEKRIAWTNVEDANHGGFGDGEIGPIVSGKIVIDLQAGLQGPRQCFTDGINQNPTSIRFDVDRFPRQRFSRQGECERGADSSVCIILYMHHDLEARWMVELASHFKADDTDVVFSAIHGDEMKVSRW